MGRRQGGGRGGRAGEGFRRAIAGEQEPSHSGGARLRGGLERADVVTVAGFEEAPRDLGTQGRSLMEVVERGHQREVLPRTDAVLEEIAAWQSRPLERVYPLVFFDALRVKVRDEGHVRNKAVHVALGVRGDGAKEILGLWIETNEGAKFWLRVMNDLKNRGVEDILIMSGR